jgi:small subunit ribosomal protein S12
MATLNQKVRWANNIYYYKWRRPKLFHGPQRLGIIKTLRICTPRKPNSARRRVARARFFTRRFVLAYIPGHGHNLRSFSKTLISGGGARDVPVVNFTCIRGNRDFLGLYGKKRRRSIYGLQLSSSLKIHIRRKFRELMKLKKMISVIFFYFI